MLVKLFCLSIMVLITSVIIFIILNLPENILLKHHSNYLKYNYKDNIDTETFDFVIVGGGSAGSVLANRLSENENVTVLLIEAGDEGNDIRIKIPAAFTQNFGTTNDWNYYSINQTNKGNHTIFLPRGKVLGGSSAINGLIYLRGSAYDYDNWEELGFKGWNYDTMLKYFKKSENQQRDRSKINNDYHGFEGEWKISDVFKLPITEKLVKAIHEEWKLPLSDDFNAEKYQKEGIGYNQVNIANGARHSVSDAFLTPKILQRKNLFIRTNTFVTKIIIENKTAIGVEVENSQMIENKDGLIPKTLKIFAKLEVILSAGAYNTPQILQLSGIGDSKLLNRFNIPVVLDNPEVGGNLQDHPSMGIISLTKEAITMDKYDYFPYNIWALFEYFLYKNNILTTNGCQVNGFVKSPIAKKNNERAPDFQIIGAPAIFVDHGRKKHPNLNGISYGLVLLNAKSKGSVKIQSSDPHQPPLIDPNVFGESEDLEKIMSMIEELKKIKNNYGLIDSLGGSLIMDIDTASIEEIRKNVLEHTFLLYHASGTAAMGKVVDDRLKVYNISNFRIVDASIMPFITRSNTNAPVVAIAEKAADMIKEDHNIK